MLVASVRLWPPTGDSIWGWVPPEMCGRWGSRCSRKIHGSSRREGRTPGVSPLYRPPETRISQAGASCLSSRPFRAHFCAVGRSVHDHAPGVSARTYDPALGPGGRSIGEKGGEVGPPRLWQRGCPGRREVSPPRWATPGLGRLLPEPKRVQSVRRSGPPAFNHYSLRSQGATVLGLPKAGPGKASRQSYAGPPPPPPPPPPPGKSGPRGPARV